MSPTSESEALNACARAAHEVNRAYCFALGDTSQPAWESAPDWQRSSAISGVRGVLNGNSPRQSHESWLAEKRATGWKYGPTKNPVTKEHPCFVDYEALPPEQQRKDRLFVMTVTEVALSLGLEVMPHLPPSHSIHAATAEATR